MLYSIDTCTPSQDTPPPDDNLSNLFTFVNDSPYQ
jgi:hypothetical protein